MLFWNRQIHEIIYNLEIKTVNSEVAAKRQVPCQCRTNDALLIFFGMESKKLWGKESPCLKLPLVPSGSGRSILSALLILYCIGTDHEVLIFKEGAELSKVPIMGQVFICKETNACQFCAEFSAMERYLLHTPSILRTSIIRPPAGLLHKYAPDFKPAVSLRILSYNFQALSWSASL